MTRRWAASLMKDLIRFETLEIQYNFLQNFRNFTCKNTRTFPKLLLLIDNLTNATGMKLCVVISIFG